MVVYEGSDDYGFADTFASAWYGSACREVACCQIRPYKIKWDAEFDGELGPAKEKEEGRKLSDELSEEIGEDLEVFTPEEFLELFGYEAERFAGEMDFAQN